MIAALDENKYNETDLIQIKLPLNIPYTVNKKNAVTSASPGSSTSNQDNPSSRVADLRAEDI